MSFLLSSARVCVLLSETKEQKIKLEVYRLVFPYIHLFPLSLSLSPRRICHQRRSF